MLLPCFELSLQLLFLQLFVTTKVDFERRFPDLVDNFRRCTNLRLLHTSQSVISYMDNEDRVHNNTRAIIVADEGLGHEGYFLGGEDGQRQVMVRLEHYIKCGRLLIFGFQFSLRDSSHFFRVHFDVN